MILFFFIILWDFLFFFFVFVNCLSPFWLLKVATKFEKEILTATHFIDVSRVRLHSVIKFS